MCGVLAIGFPVLLVMSFVLGIMYLIALRYVMLGGQRAIEAAGNGWHFFRARFKDTFLLWLINAGLNIAASFAFAIPVVVVGFAVGIPVVAAGMAGEWGILAGLVALLVILIWILAAFYNAIWGTFTSALWTIFFRDVAGMSVAAVAVVPSPMQPVAPAGWGAAPPPAEPPPMAPWQPPESPAPEPPATAPPTEPRRLPRSRRPHQQRRPMAESADC
jgi:hypothetical protein